MEQFGGNEKNFAEHFLQKGMTVLDIGAHHGFYTLLASKKVGVQGKVIAFEPSPRELNKLRWHIRINRCRNVQVEELALGSAKGEAEFFLVSGKLTGHNSFHLLKVYEPTVAVRVLVTTLDEYLAEHQIKSVDFVKMDVEGAELGVLEGAWEFLRRRPRPVILCEVQDKRTQPWGYEGKEIVTLLQDSGYLWFNPLIDGSLEPIYTDQETFDGNFVAVPEERMEQIQGLISREASPGS